MLNQEPFKIKYNGQTLTVCVMERNELINERTLQCLPSPYENKDDLKSLCWMPSLGVGDRIDEYSPDRIYIEVLSHFYHGESTSCRLFR